MSTPDGAGAEPRRPPWGGRVLARSVLLLLAGLVLAGLATAQSGLGAAAAPAGLLLLWLCFAAAIAWAVAKEARGDLAGSLGLRRWRMAPLPALALALLIGLVLRALSMLLEAAVLGPAAAQHPPAFAPGPWLWLTGFAGPIVLAPTLEEAFFRGVVQTSVQGVLGGRVWPSARAGRIGSVIVTAILFAAAHAVSATEAGGLLVTGISTLLVGLGCGALAVRTGSIVPPIVAHAIFNASAVVYAVATTGLPG